MAVSRPPVRRPAIGPGRSAADDPGRGRAALDIDGGASTPGSPRIYRFLRLLVHGLNRLCFRTTVDGPTRCPPRGR